MKNQHSNQSRTCRRCGSQDFTRVHRHRIIKSLLPWLPVRRYQCRKCNRSFYEYYKKSTTKTSTSH